MPYLENLNWESLPCGCRMALSPDEAFYFEPHALDCEYATYVQEEVLRQGKLLIVKRI